MLFAIDQQQFTQGYLGVTYMYLYMYNLNTPGSIVVQTGPGFVTQDTAASVISYSERGTR
jgi:simple sugar transport system substrate-binding protein